MNEPQVSIIMAVHDYNNEYLKESIDSIIEQYHEDFEFIIVDGASTDGTSETIMEYNDSRIHHERLDMNPGFTPMLIHGMNIAKGEYIARQDADDVSVRHRIRSQVKHLEDHKDVDILGTSYRVINHEGRNVKNVIMNFCHKDVLHDLRYGSPFPHGSVMMRRKVLDEHGYDPDVEKAQDYDLWMRIAKEGRFKFCVTPDILYHWRDHEGGVGNSQWMKQFIYSERARMIFNGHVDVDPKQISCLAMDGRLTKIRIRYLALKHRRDFYNTKGRNKYYHLISLIILEPNYLIDGLIKRFRSSKYSCVECMDYTDWTLCPNCKMMSVPPENDVCNGCERDKLWYIG